MPWRENKGVCQFRGNLDGCFGVAYGKMFWSSEDRVRVPFHGTFSRHGRIKASFILLIWLNENVRFHYAESRQNKP